MICLWQGTSFVVHVVPEVSPHSNCQCSTSSSSSPPLPLAPTQSLASSPSSSHVSGWVAAWLMPVLRVFGSSEILASGHGGGGKAKSWTWSTVRSCERSNRNRSASAWHYLSVERRLLPCSVHFSSAIATSVWAALGEIGLSYISGILIKLPLNREENRKSNTWWGWLLTFEVSIKNRL